jgi:hypothetical protein
MLITDNKKILFVHVMRTGGTFLLDAFNKLDSNFLNFNSWKLNLNRDWDEDELLQICHLNLNCKVFIQNHCLNLNKDLVLKFKDNGFKVFTFLRNPLDIICSLYYYFNCNGIVDINDFINDLLSEDSFLYKEFVIDYYDIIDYIVEFNKDNHDECVKKYFFPNLDKCDSSLYMKLNTENKDYEFYLNSNIISKYSDIKLKNSFIFKNYIDVKQKYCILT